MPIVVRAKKDESTDGVIRRFKKKVMTEDVLTEVREREFHKSPSIKRKEHNNEIKRRKWVEKKQRERAAR